VHRMQKAATWFDHNIAAWSTSISLGYLMGFMPEVAHFFGLPLDVRHVTLNSGMFAFAAVRFGSHAFSQLWLYSAVAGIAVMFVLNLGVSFAVASFVALRAYDVGSKERRSILRDVLNQIVKSPLRFLYPVEIKRPDAQAAEPLTLAPADQPAESTGIAGNP
jgi:site-specific recombinase